MFKIHDIRSLGGAILLICSYSYRFFSMTIASWSEAGTEMDFATCLGAQGKWMRVDFWSSSSEDLALYINIQK